MADRWGSCPEPCPFEDEHEIIDKMARSTQEEEE